MRSYDIMSAFFKLSDISMEETNSNTFCAIVDADKDAILTNKDEARIQLGCEIFTREGTGHHSGQNATDRPRLSLFVCPTDLFRGCPYLFVEHICFSNNQKLTIAHFWTSYPIAIISLPNLQ